MPIVTGTHLTPQCESSATKAGENVLTFTAEGSEFISDTFHVADSPYIFTAYRLPVGATLKVEMVRGCGDEIYGPYILCGCEPELNNGNRIIALGIPGSYRLRLTGASLIEQEDLFIAYQFNHGFDWIAFSKMAGCC